MKIYSLPFLVIATLTIAACQPNTQSTEQETTDSAPAVVDQYTLEEVATHATEDDCWMAVEGKVYDVTEYMDEHPNGAIVKGCGKEATEMYRNIGGHNQEYVDELLSDYEIGVLAE